MWRKVFTVMYLQQRKSDVFELKAKKTSHWYFWPLHKGKILCWLSSENANRQKWFSSYQLHSTSKIISHTKQNNPWTLRLQTFPMSWKSIYLPLANHTLQNENILSCNHNHEICVPKPRRNNVWTHPSSLTTK